MSKVETFVEQMKNYKADKSKETPVVTPAIIVRVNTTMFSKGRK